MEQPQSSIPTTTNKPQRRSIFREHLQQEETSDLKPAEHVRIEESLDLEPLARVNQTTSDEKAHKSFVRLSGRRMTDAEAKEFTHPSIYSEWYLHYQLLRENKASQGVKGKITTLIKAASACLAK